MSRFEHVQKMPDDPILKLPLLFAADSRSNKVNLGIGAYKNNEGKSVVLSAVSKAEQQLAESKLDKEYPPISGLPNFNAAVEKLIYGSDIQASAGKQLFTMQTLGGTGALRIGNQLLATVGLSQIYVPQPTWPNHPLILKYAGMQAKTYTYYDKEKHTLNFDRMCADIQQMPENSVILLHGCCHNPSGVDPSKEQWKELSQIILKQKLLPFFDLAYHGLAQGLEPDSFPLRYFIEQGHEIFLAYSCSKNFGLYGERVGALSLLTKDPSATERLASHCRQIVRANYSMPPLHGARIVTAILNDESLKAEWVTELTEMRKRIHDIRKTLVKKLEMKGITHLEMLENDHGLFSYVGLAGDQPEHLLKDYGIYMPSDGRINVAGLNTNNMDYVVDAFASVLKIGL